MDRTVVLFGSEVDPEPELRWARGLTLIANDEAQARFAPWAFGVHTVTAGGAVAINLRT